WNTARIVVKGDHVEHWLNGIKILQYTRGSEQYKQAVAASKFKSTKGFGEASSSPVLLQAHGDKITFRNIKIKEL
ncbi:MAG: 3-keto-disaccharide hydrolase, partial [Segetibacter sp.]